MGSLGSRVTGRLYLHCGRGPSLRSCSKRRRQARAFGDVKATDRSQFLKVEIWRFVS